MRRYKQLKISEAASGIPRGVIVTGVLGILVTLLEGMLQLNQYHETVVWSTGARSSKYDLTNFSHQKR
jgi:hypothetical protein